MIAPTRAQVAVTLVLALAVLALLGSRLARTGTARQERGGTLVHVRRGAESPGARALLFVHVVGAVRRPGLYRLRDGSRVADAVGRAGGAGPLADVTLVNLAAPLVDGQQIVVPRRPAVGSAAPVEPGAAAGTKVSLASATVEQLDELPGIGPVTAQKIVDWRQSNGPFRSVDDLDSVPGIGPARVEQLRELVTP